MVFRVFYAYLNSPQKSEHSEYRQMGCVFPLRQAKTLLRLRRPISHICAKIYGTLPTCHSHPSHTLSLRGWGLSVTDPPPPTPNPPKNFICSIYDYLVQAPGSLKNTVRTPPCSPNAATK